MTVLLMLVGCALDWRLGEPALRWHPLVAFGRLVDRVEALLLRPAQGPWRQTLAGFLGWLLLVAPWTLLAALLLRWPALYLPASVLGLYWALGFRSLHEHAQPVIAALKSGNETMARDRASLIVSRDASQMNIEASTIESILENGLDAVFGALFWFVVAGLPGVVLYRLANTLDARWGYRTPRYRYFGWCAARIDDLLNWVPARLTALSYALLGSTGTALRCWRQQAPGCESPNGGPVMASGAGALELRLGGPACYHGILKAKPWLGNGAAPQAEDIERALKLVRNALLLWLSVGLVLAGYMTWSTHA
ncbi:cobalamin biosynthesis protein CobD [Marinobacterium nitratireducens]|uniref:Cobalamin biosynthesis protein CobD n=1 Tax=Marinobacterium nitratireducens TaxID=518897 RepID=A0A917ZF84_9GAMM|nr:adenosylcobinamide-phosphate synthase CbiB [Marinobacterium nitratireducens]GGO81442.1 cobalamin biosynthesis protein CobD [Marinobacterium nitratireducens]